MSPASQSANRERTSSQKRTPLVWIWEFSKRMVLVCSCLYVIGFFYSCAVMLASRDYTCLGTFISESSDILRTCVFGYFVKAGVENVTKIVASNHQKNEEEENEIG